MYVTRPLSLYKSPKSLSSSTSEGPSSGYLVLQDDQDQEDSVQSRCCSSSYEFRVTNLPFPQNAFLRIHPGDEDGHAEFLFVPVIDQPLSSNRYYIMVEGKGDSLETSNSKDEQQPSCFFCSTIYAKPRPLDPENMYQQFEILPSKTSKGRFSAKPVALNGVLPHLFSNQEFHITSRPITPALVEAEGLDAPLRGCLPSLEFSVSHQNPEPVVVGKWHCPFMFVREGTLKDQIRSSAFYQLSLEQRWEKIWACENHGGREKSRVDVDAVVARKSAALYGMEAEEEERNKDDGFVWFVSVKDWKGEKRKVGLSGLLVERMFWEQERFGRCDGSEKHVSFGMSLRKQAWTRFACYLLVERFYLKRMDESLVLSFDFNHTHQLRSKWE